MTTPIRPEQMSDKEYINILLDYCNHMDRMKQLSEQPVHNIGNDGNCCRKHWEEKHKSRAGAMDLGGGHFALINPIGMPFMVCKTCGNKRCPKATDCSLACTNSNQPGQPGSIYG